MTRLLAQFVQTAGRANEFSSLSVLVARVPPLVRSMMTRGRLHRGKLLSVSDIPRCRRDDRRSRRLVVNPIVSPAEMRVHVVRDRCRYGCTAVAVLEHRVSSVSTENSEPRGTPCLSSSIVRAFLYARLRTMTTSPSSRRPKCFCSRSCSSFSLGAASPETHPRRVQRCPEYFSRHPDADLSRRAAHLRCLRSWLSLYLRRYVLQLSQLLFEY